MSRAARARLLVVEDEEALAEGLMFNLQRKDYEVDLARDGEEALARTSAHRYDLILFDVRLPKVDGLRRVPAPADGRGKQTISKQSFVGSTRKAAVLLPRFMGNGKRSNSPHNSKCCEWKSGFARCQRKSTPSMAVSCWEGDPSRPICW